MKAAGWPQEDAKFVWCGKSLAATSTLGFVEAGNSGALLGCGRPDGGPDWWTEDENDDPTTAAPTFAEIAERLPGYSERGDRDRWRMIRWRKMYLAETFENDDPLAPCSNRCANENPAEAAALLWLTLNEKEASGGA